ncbi:four-jointed box protein 1-like [Saccoglossus kowalevskii]
MLKIGYLLRVTAYVAISTIIVYLVHINSLDNVVMSQRSPPTKESDQIVHEQPTSILSGNGSINLVCSSENSSSVPFINLTGSRSYNMHGLTVVEHGMLWSKDLESLAPKGPTVFDLFNNSKQSVDVPVHHILNITSYKCGAWSSPGNVAVGLVDGSNWCVRPKMPCHALGEVMAFYLSLIMCMNYIPPVVLTKPDASKWNADGVNRYVKRKRWATNGTISMSKWIPNLVKCEKPSIMVKGDKLLHVDNPMFSNLTKQQLLNLLVYSDVVVLDYLMAETDRILRAYRLHPTRHTKMKYVHNLFVDKSGKTWMIDNEMAFFFGDTFHLKNNRIILERMLRSVCIFRAQTTTKIKQLYEEGNASEILLKLVNVLTDNAHFSFKSRVMMCKTGKSKQFRNKNITVKWAESFETRIKDVYNWMTSCSQNDYNLLLKSSNFTMPYQN